VREGQRFMQVTTKAGQTVTGKLLNQDTHSVQVLTEQEQLSSYLKDDLSAWTIVPRRCHRHSTYCPPTRSRILLPISYR